jgi:serine protease Do
MGNSGGALVNTRAELVGITTAIISPSGTYAGNSFAVPVTIVKKVVDDLKEFGAVQRAIIGVNIADVTAEIAKNTNSPSVNGVFISGLTEGGAAEEAGIKLMMLSLK